MRVAVHYSDGSYCMYDPSTRKCADGVDRDKWLANNTFEIPDEEWARYQEHCEKDRVWQQLIMSYDSVMYAKRNQLTEQE